MKVDGVSVRLLLEAALIACVNGRTDLGRTVLDGLSVLRPGADALEVGYGIAELLEGDRAAAATRFRALTAAGNACAPQFLQLTDTAGRQP